MAPKRTTHPIRAKRPRSRSVTAALSLAIALALSSTTGCMVMDELDTAAAKMPSTGKHQEDKTKKEQAKAGASAADRVAASKAAVLEASRQWWKQAKTINTHDAPEGVVSCRLPEGTKFMSKDDCVVQGGRPGNASS